MKRYDDLILGILLDKYERSTLYDMRNRRNVSISVTITRDLLPEYYVEGSLAYDSIHEQLEDLEEAGLIELVWKGGKRRHILEKCILKTDEAQRVYKRLNRKPRREQEKRIKDLCCRYKGKSPVSDAFLDWVQTRLRSGGGIRKYVDIGNPSEFEQICELLIRILENKEDCYLRQFSIRYYNDSKTAEKHINKACRIIRDFSGESYWSELEPDEILEEFGIYKNPSIILMKGKGTITAPTRINLAEIPDGIGLSGAASLGIQWEQGKEAPDIVITIENLTSFHRFDCGKGRGKNILAIYLGGYANRARCEFLKRLYRAFPDCRYYHFGDIDAGGFRILRDLRERTGIPFEEYGMDAKTYKKYVKFGRELTENDIASLTRMIMDPGYKESWDVFRLMLGYKKKLEQECVDGPEL